LDFHAVRDAVAKMLQLLVRGRGGDQQAFAVAGGQAADDAGAGDGGVADGDYALELGFEDAVGEGVLAGWVGEVQAVLAHCSSAHARCSLLHTCRSSLRRQRRQGRRSW
jgi:hypothetical protein